jgi:hypothetical protein
MPDHDFELLANRILAFARQAIAEDGAVIPVGAVVSPEGEVVPIKRIQLPNEEDSAETLLNELLGVFRGLAEKNQARAVAWCVDMRVIPPGSSAKTDALVLFFESSSGKATVLVTPYSQAPGPATTFAEPYVQMNRPQIFSRID